MHARMHARRNGELAMCMMTEQQLPVWVFNSDNADHSMPFNRTD